eukprot:635157-Pelagomonas_calceolata.AAC.1
MPSAFTVTLDLLCAPYVEHSLALPTLRSGAQTHIYTECTQIVIMKRSAFAAKKLEKEALDPTLLLWRRAIEKALLFKE